MTNLLLPLLFTELYPFFLSPSPHFLGVQGFILVALHSIAFFVWACHCVFRPEKGMWSDAQFTHRYSISAVYLAHQPQAYSNTDKNHNWSSQYAILLIICTKQHVETKGMVSLKAIMLVNTSISCVTPRSTN